ncbi:MAG: glycosyltransferase family 2 protein [Jatrophihabitans sp.]|uniref:glycosyltransferase family 2 protein n=1 Tax=Jatrophihabitans sp. TaxID=1932789 RepID=UPI003F7DAD76
MPAEPVAAIIPTIGGPTLDDAVRSALAQTHPAMQVVVVADGPRDLALAADLRDDPRVRVVATPVNGGPGAARLFGLGVTDADWIAYLDDDDTWAPHKIERQLAAARDATRPRVVACRVTRVHPDGTHDVVPRRLTTPDVPLADYLFTRDTVDPFEAVLMPSMLLLPRSAAARAAEVHEQRIHEDWSHLLLLEDAGIEVVMLPDALVRYRVAPTGGSASSRTSWRVSRAWFDDRIRRLGARAHAEGLLTVTAPLAAAQGDRRGWWEVVRAAARTRAARREAWSILGIVTLVPSRLRAAAARARSSSSRSGRGDRG